MQEDFKQWLSVAKYWSFIPANSIRTLSFPIPRPILRPPHDISPPSPLSTSSLSNPPPFRPLLSHRTLFSIFTPAATLLRLSSPSITTSYSFFHLTPILSALLGISLLGTGTGARSSGGRGPRQYREAGRDEARRGEASQGRRGRARAEPGRSGRSKGEREARV